MFTKLKNTAYYWLVDIIDQYVGSTVEQYRRIILDRTARSIGYLLSSIVFILLIIFLIFFISMSAAFYIGAVYENYPLAFLLLGGFYLLLLVILLIFRAKLFDKPIKKRMSRIIHGKD